MDQNTLVSSGHALVKAMDEVNYSPRLAMWVQSTDTGRWKLWIVPQAGVTDKYAFYRRIAGLVSKKRAELGGLDASDTEMITDKHPAAIGISRFVRLDSLGSVHFGGNKFNGFYLPNGIILRSRQL